MNGTNSAPAHRRLSRETRHLLIAACVALLALWILARLRFPDRPVTTNPISPMLTQITPRPAFGELASEVARVRVRLGDSVVAVPDPAHPHRGEPAVRVALRIRPDAAALFGRATDHHDVLAADRASGLVIVRVPDLSPAGAPVAWVPAALDAPRFLMMTSASADGLSVQPVFIGSFSPSTSPAWSGPVWLPASGLDIPPGALLFTVEGELVGLTVEDGDRRAVVPAATLLADARQLLERGSMDDGQLGIDAQALTIPVAAATHAVGGVVVTWVAEDGPAAGRLRTGDVVETLDAAPVRTLREWQVAVARVSAGQTVTLGVRTGGELRTVALVATPVARRSAGSLGLTLRYVSGLGSEVVRVDPGSAAASAGLMRGDIITVMGTTAAPTPARIRLAFESSEDTGPLLVAFTRGAAHHVTALAR